jgi:nitrite reductase (NO-forming)
MFMKALLLIAASIGVCGPLSAAIGQDEPAGSSTEGVADIVRDASDLPPPIARRDPKTVRVELEAVEIDGQLGDGARYRYWTFNGKVPGPFIRIRIGDTVDVFLKNADRSIMMHNVDFHAVTGPGGGAVATTTLPGETHGFTFTALHPGLYVYHCAAPMAAQHIANGMYGLILVEPSEGLPKVDREFYVMQGELYTEQAYGTRGDLTESIDKLLAETPEYYVFNGAVDALVHRPLVAKVDETVRIFFGVGGPNKSSSLHVIGELFDKAYPLGSITSPPTNDVQTISVPPGGAAIVELKVEMPGRFIIVDHSLSRMERGLKGALVVQGEDRGDVFKPHQPIDPAAMTGH